MSEMLKDGAEFLRDERKEHNFRTVKYKRGNTDCAGRPVAGLRSEGITLVFMAKVCPPLAKGQRRDIADLIMGVVDYDKSEK